MLFKDFTWTPEDFISQNRFIKLAKDNADTHLFIKTDLIEDNALIEYKDEIQIYPNPKQRIWITGMSDYTIRLENAMQFDGLYDKWYAINVSYKHPKIQAIPLGINTHTEGCAEQEQQLYKISNTSVPMSDKLAYMNFNAYNWLAERAFIHYQYENTPWVTFHVNKKLPYKEYCENVKAHKFTFCPRGNGPDTHRLWESIYLGSIPIVLDYPEMEPFFEKLPVLKVKSWLKITDDFLEMEYERIHETEYDFSMMRFGYWKDLILSAV